MSITMRSLLLLFLFLFPLVIPGKASAYNEDGRIHFEALFEVLSRDITEENAQFAGENFPETTASAESLRLLGKLSVRIIDPLEIYGLVGGSDLDIDEFGFNSDFTGTYGGGARLILYRDRNPRAPYQIYIDYRFLQFKVDNSILFDPTIVDNSGNLVHLLPNGGESVNEKIRWQEHAVKFGVMGRYYEWEPYGGIRFSFVNGKDTIPTSVQTLHLDLKQSDTFGIFFGSSYYLSASDKAALFAEVSFFDQYSLAGGIRVGF